MADRWLDDLSGVVNIKHDIRKDLLEWIRENYETAGQDKQIRQLVALAIETFLDKEAEPYISLAAPREMAIWPGFYTEDIEKGDILSFTDKALSFGYYITGPYPRRTYRWGLNRGKR